MAEQRVLGVGTCVAATAKAIQVELQGRGGSLRLVWLPKSAITDDSEVWDVGKDQCGPGKVVVYEWFEETEQRAG